MSSTLAHEIYKYNFILFIVCTLSQNIYWTIDNKEYLSVLEISIYTVV